MSINFENIETKKQERNNIIIKISRYTAKRELYTVYRKHDEVIIYIY